MHNAKETCCTLANLKRMLTGTRFFPLALLLLVASLVLVSCSDDTNPVAALERAEEQAQATDSDENDDVAVLNSGEVTSLATSTTTSSRGDFEICGNGEDDDGDGDIDETTKGGCRESTTGSPTSGDGVVPEFWTDNPSCTAAGYGFGFKIEGNSAADYTGTFTFTGGNGILTGGALEDQSNSVTLSSSDGIHLDWSATLGIDAVIMKGGPNSNIYNYDPEDTEDTGLATPQESFGLSHVEFCYDYEVDVSKDANTELTRTYEWDITKTPDKSYVGFPGDVFPHEYTITVDRTGSTDSDWKVSGTITVDNNTPFDATIEDVTDEISGVGPVTPDCGVTFPYMLAAGETLTCSYSSDLPDGTDRTNTATVTTTTDSDVGGGAATAGVLFDENTTINEVNAEINVTDDFASPNDDSDNKKFGPLGDGESVNYSRDFECPLDESLYTDGVYTATFTNTATIDETGDSDNATVDITCYIPAKADVIKTTTEGDEDIGQFPFSFELYDPDGALVETKTIGTGGGTVTFDADLEAEGTWTVKEILPDGWVSTTDLTCTFDVDFPAAADETFTCTFDNVEKSRVDLLKLTNGLETVNQTWSFKVYEGPDGFGGTEVAADNTPPALLDFGTVDLDPLKTYTLCELEVPAGYSTFWQIDTNGDGIGDNTVVPYNPNADDDPPEDLGNRCVDFGAGTSIPLESGTTLHFVVDNQAPGGAPRTPGYWKNWNRCTGGNQQYTADANGGWEEGFWLLEDVLDPAIGGGIIWDDIQNDDDLLFRIEDCEDAVLILDKRDLDGKKQASDPLHNLATHLLAAQLNFGAGACTTQDVLDTALEAETLLDTYNFDGYGHDQLKKKDPDAELANQLAEYLDEYNNGAFCGQ